MSGWTAESRHVDVLVLTVLRLEFDAVLRVDAGAVPASTWEVTHGPSNLPVAFRAFTISTGRPLRVAVAVSADRGATAATNTLLPLVADLKPRCIAMCGVCAGRRGKTQLGDVVAAERLFYRDAERGVLGEIQQDVTTYQLRDDWKAALHGMNVVARFRDAAWFRARPISTEWREHRALVAIRDGASEPWRHVDPALDQAGWASIVASLRGHGLLAKTGRELTAAGHHLVEKVLFEHAGKLPDLSPVGAFQSFRLHVAPLASGSGVVEEEAVWAFISRSMRRTLALETEGAALGELAHRQRQYGMDAIVMKGVMDFADHGRDDHFKEFAARASAECLFAFLREQIPTEHAVGFDDLLAPGTSAMPVDSLAPSSLLLARNTVVPWHDGGRLTIMADLDAWADDQRRDVSVLLLHAPGGVGKTRLAIEWVRRRRTRHDIAGFLMPRADGPWLERLCGLGSTILIVIDYAERRADLLEILERVAAFAAGPGPRRRIRILLLARSDGDWWSDLRRRSSAVDALLGDIAPRKLSPLALTVPDREAVFREASAVFAALRNQVGAPPPPALHDTRFERVLYLHMAALAAVEEAAFNAASLMDVILDHEERFWMREAKDRTGVALDMRLARRLVAAATLRGGLHTEDEAQDMCERFEKRPRSRDDDAMIALLHDLYARPGEPAYLPGLEPDLLGEEMVLRVARPPRVAGAAAGDAWIDHVFTLADDESSLTNAFVVLGRASVDSAPAVRSWITRLLHADLSTRAVLALRADKVVGQRSACSALGDLLAEALEQRGTAVIAADLDREGIPFPTASLRRVAAWRSRRLLEILPSGDDAAAMSERAAWLTQQGADYHAAGHLHEAVEATQKAVGISRALTARNPEFLPLLAASLNNLGNSLAELGRCDAALEAMTEAVRLYRKLALHAPRARDADLPRSLNNLGAALSARGHHDRALDVMREAVGLYTKLAARNDAFQAPLAMSLNNLGAEWSALGQYRSALEATSKAWKLYRPLAKWNPDAFQPELARSLHNLGIQLSGLGRHDEALKVTHKAVKLYRRLATRYPDAFQADLAKSLNNLGKRWSELGNRHEALAATRQAVAHYRTFTARNREAFQADLAKSLNNLADQLSDLEQHEEALEATREAVNLYRVVVTRNAAATQPSADADAVSSTNSSRQRNELSTAMRQALGLRHITMTTRRPDEFQLQLAKSLTHLGSRLHKRGQRDEALAVTREAADLYLALAILAPEVFRPDLARSLNHLGNVLSHLGQRDVALSVTLEAVGLCRLLVRQNSDAFEADLARSLVNLSQRRSAVGQQTGALDAAREAVDIYRKLADRKPEVFLRDLAGSLSLLGHRLSAQGQPDDALAVTCEAVALYRMLATSDPDAFRPDLARSLNHLGNRLSGHRLQDAALVATQEAVELFRILVGRNPDRFEADLAICLNNLSSRQSGMREQQAALDAASEAVRLYRRLAERDPGAFQPDLASSLNVLGLRLCDQRQLDAALEAAWEAVDIYRKLARRAPQHYRSALAASLHNLGSLLGDLGRPGDAVTATIEAMALRRALAARSPVPSASLAASLSNLGNLWSDLGEKDSAVAATHEAVELYRALSTRNPDGFLPDLVKNLHSFGIRLNAAGQYDAALAVSAEARKLWGELATRNPEAHELLAPSLNDPSIQPSDLEQQSVTCAVLQVVPFSVTIPMRSVTIPMRSMRYDRADESRDGALDHGTSSIDGAPSSQLSSVN